MVKQTANFAGTALPAIADPTERVPWLLRLGYAWKSLTGRVHIMGPIDVTHVKTERYMEGRVRVYLSKQEAEDYHAVFLPQAEDETR